MWRALGRRVRDPKIMIDFAKKRAVILAQTAWIEGTALETIPPGQMGFNEAMVLVRHDWDRMYFVIKREGWTDDEYFELAEKLQAQKGIVKP